MATARQYKYYITTVKDPFSGETAWYYPFSVDVDLLNEAAAVLYQHSDYTSFSKRNTQVFTKNCTIAKSGWSCENSKLIYTVEANRFLRGNGSGVGRNDVAGRPKENHLRGI